MTDNAPIIPKIMIVDDVEMNLFVLRKIISFLDMEVDIVEASSGNSALALTFEHNFALILLDVQMPEMSGYEVAEILKSSEHTKSIPIIFVTANANETANLLQGYACGAIDYLKKPLDKTVLLSKIKILLELFIEKERLKQESHIARESLSHLRPPIHSILEISQELLAGSMEEEQKKLLKTIQGSGAEIESMINQALKPDA